MTAQCLAGLGSLQPGAAGVGGAAGAVEQDAAQGGGDGDPAGRAGGVAWGQTEQRHLLLWRPHLGTANI